MRLVVPSDNSFGSFLIIRYLDVFFKIGPGRSNPQQLTLRCGAPPGDDKAIAAQRGECMEAGLVMALWVTGIVGRFWGFKGC